jgi:hypothetical protein
MSLSALQRTVVLAKETSQKPSFKIYRLRSFRAVLYVPVQPLRSIPSVQDAILH